MSLPTHDPGRLLDLGRRLRAAARRGRAGHRLGLPHPRAAVPDRVPHRRRRPRAGRTDFDLWAAEALARGDVDTLASYRDLAPGMPYAHPTVEHFTPLFVTLGAADRPERAGPAADRRLLDGPVEALAAGRLTRGSTATAPGLPGAGHAAPETQRIRSLRIALSEITRLLDVLLVVDVGGRGEHLLLHHRDVAPGRCTSAARRHRAATRRPSPSARPTASPCWRTTRRGCR